MKKGARLLLVLITGLFFLCDQALKYLAIHSIWPTKLINPYFGWQPFFNTGVAFSLPAPIFWQILITLIILGTMFYLIIKNKNGGSQFLILTIGGAISNLIDRIAFGKTIDYFLILTGIINLGDVLIVGGILLFLIQSIKENQI